jgi:YesN/AraC family two-component response regulator
MQTILDKKPHSTSLSNKVIVRQTSAEPAVITEAKKYIEKYHTKDVSLGDVAKAVHISKYYLCTMFRNATGLYFTDYVTLLRIERAKHLLLDPNLRISHIAFEVGFQSAANFNRVFKRILGESPTEYRLHSI